jgi:tetratricopeptide (TPR) repeat protein
MTMMLEHLDERKWPQPVRIEKVRQAMTHHFQGFFEKLLAEKENWPLTQLEIGWVHQHLGHFYLRRSEHARAELHFRAALAFHEDLMAEYPNDSSYIWMYAQSLYRLGTVLYVTGRKEEAHGYYLLASEQYRRQLQMHPGGGAYNDLAFFLVNCPDAEVRDTAEAARLASRAIDLAPDNVSCWSALGRAQYRNGDWKAAVDTLQESIRRARGEHSIDFFFLAMAYQKLGKRERARHYFDQGKQILGREKYPSVTLQLIHTEAATLLGIPERPMRKAKEESHQKD